jgi:cytochrome d ubiquinol oxidase subunit I
LLAIPNDKAGKNSWEITVPNALGYILEFKQNLSEPVQGLNSWQPEDRPHMIGLVYYSFRTMIAIGFFLAGLMAITVLQWLRGKLADGAIADQKWLMRAWIFSAPLGYIAVESGWIVRCVGRQPWTVYGAIRTTDAASNLPASNVLTSLSIFAVVYSLLFVSALFFGSRIIRHGPNMDLPIPEVGPRADIEIKPAEHRPDQRPLETPQSTSQT